MSPNYQRSKLERRFAFQIKTSEIVSRYAHRIEFRFLRERMFRFDFAWPQLMIAVEIQGGTFIYGGHNRGVNIQNMHVKHALAVLDGWTVLYGDGDQVRSLELLTWLETLIKQRCKT